MLQYKGNCAVVLMYAGVCPELKISLFQAEKFELRKLNFVTSYLLSVIYTVWVNGIREYVFVSVNYNLMEEILLHFTLSTTISFLLQRYEIINIFLFMNRYVDFSQHSIFSSLGNIITVSYLQYIRFDKILSDSISEGNIIRTY